MRVRLALAVSACLLGICAGGTPPRNATIFFDGSSFNPPEVEIDAGGFLTVKTSEGPGGLPQPQVVCECGAQVLLVCLGKRLK